MNGPFTGKVAHAFATVVLASVVVATEALGEDATPRMSLKAPANQSFDWGGWYIGGHLGFTAGRSSWSATEPGGNSPSLSGSFDFPANFNFMRGTGSYYAGLQAGYNYVLPSRWILGFEADFSFPNSDVITPNSIAGTQVFGSPLTGQASYSELVVASGTTRGRVGYAFDNLLVYGTGGLAWTYDQFTRTQLAGTSAAASPGTVESLLKWRFGWALGAGIEIPLSRNWTARAEYMFTSFPRSDVTFGLADQRFDSNLMQQSLRLGMNYQFGSEPKSSLSPLGLTALATDGFALHGQTTFVSQYAFPFHSPYHGPNSLDSNSGRQTTDVTFYVGARLWDGAELWINPEIDQGFGLTGTLGVAGFPSAEAYKAGASYPYTRLPRAFIRQTIDLGGEPEKVAADLNQFSGTRTSDRLVITVGKFGVVEVFDTNKYAHDPRADFLNWAVADTGTFDYAADAWAYTVGGAVEWYKGNWTLRGGIFDMSIAPNTTALDPRFQQFQWVGEIEHRHELWGQPGKVAVTGFWTRGRMGDYSDAIQLAAQTGGPADIAAVRRYQSRTGLSLNLEQQIVPEVGFFARTGFANGNVEPYEFTDIDRTLAGGFAFGGKQWGRPEDTFGIAGILNDISGVHKAFLNAGGTGILVGDGQLPNPGLEKIIETYYTLPVSSLRVTFDYQLIVNPAYNRDRGPVSVIGTRLHSTF